MKMKISKILSTILGIGILIFLIYKINPVKLLETLENFNFLYLIPIVLTLLLVYILASINIWTLSRPIKKIKLSRVIKYNFFVLFFTVFLPGKIADLLMIYFLKEEKIELSKSTTIVVLDKTISLIMKIIFSIFGAIFILKQFNFLFIGLPLIIFSVIVLSSVIINSKKFKEFLIKFIFKKYASLVKDVYNSFKLYTKNYKKYIRYNVLITLVKNFVESTLFFFLFLAFGQQTNIIEIFFVFSLLSVIILVVFPIGISGLGARELIGIVIFGTIGIDAAIIFNSFILRLVLIYIINLLIFSKYHSELNILKKLKIWEKLKSKFNQS
ncbi:hypothetical protein CL617_03525 [archaeon]|nr:hypothetical protein [archaeon]|tara:strand:- start:1202 stop:2179 length:978 start_codon:yes stop_codon:yes gene_type:complete